MFHLTFLLLFLILAHAAYPIHYPRASNRDQNPPETNSLIDLGYARHVPTFINETASGRRIKVYRNIRFANAPVGNLRFRRPDTTLPRIEGVQDGNLPWGSTGCIASAPAAVPFPEINGTTRGHEDCLFLDVYVPDDVGPDDRVPVLHNFFGSAYAFGTRDMWSSPFGLFDMKDDGNKFIYVTNSYRLGVLGWTSVPGLDMDANVGMHDCLAAVEWTANYIGLFGGDKERVTVIGQSAGAGIIQLLTVLNGGCGKKLPFQQAFVSSPDLPPRNDVGERQRRLFDTILETANCTSLDCLRHVSEETMIKVNDYMINQVPSDAGGGVFGPSPGFGPVPDGKYIPDIPERLFRQGRHHDLRGLIVGNMANEGMGLSRDTDMPGYFPSLVGQIFRNISNETVEKIQSNYDYRENPAKLAWDWTTDVIFACNAFNLAKTFASRTYRYIMSIPPATHGFDMSFYFYVDQETTPVPDPSLAHDIQLRLLRFIHGEEIPWPRYEGKESMTNIINITDGGFEFSRLPLAQKKRCEVINKIVLDPRNGVVMESGER